MDRKTRFVESDEVGLRLDRYLTARFPEQSRTYFQHLIAQGLVLLNGERAKKRLIVSEGDEVEVAFLLSPEISLEPEPIPLNILYEDEVLLAIDKPAGLVVHPGAGNPRGTFVNALLYHCKKLPGEGLRPGIVHRLDKGTTGVLIAAKTEQAQQHLLSQFAERRAQKTYIAVCVGNPGEGELVTPVGRHPVDRKRMAVVREGKEAITGYRTVGFDGRFSLVHVQLKTGRTHQIRVHMHHLGTPILGDPVYGSSHWNKKEGVDRQLLHAAKLEISHPTDDRWLTIEAPLPRDMEERSALILGNKLL